MQVKKIEKSPTRVELTITATPEELKGLKVHVLQNLSDKVSVPGFRKDKVPLELVEKNIDSAQLQQEFLQEAINHLYSDALKNTQILVVAQPTVSIITFVPFSSLTFTAEVDCVGKISLPKHKNFRLKKPKVQVTADDVKRVLVDLQQKSAERKEVDRKSKTGDELNIDFEGKDTSGKLINNASAKNYTIVLGSQFFVPGFEENLKGLTKDQSKEFTVKFPKDYGVKMLAAKPVIFSVTVNKISELTINSLNDSFAAKVSPFKTINELKDDIKKQIVVERTRQADIEYENQVISALTSKSKFDIPETLIDEQIDRELEELKRNLVYRGTTFNEYLEQENTDEAGLKQKLRAPSEQKVKAGLMLGSISETEKFQVSEAEINERIEVLKAQYTDPVMRAELDKNNAKKDIGSRILTEKTVKYLTAIASKN